MNKDIIYIDERSQMPVKLNFYDTERNLLDATIITFRFIYIDRKKNKYEVEHRLSTETQEEYFKNCYIKDGSLFVRFENTGFVTGRLTRELWLKEYVTPEKGDGFKNNEMICVLVEPSLIEIISGKNKNNECYKEKPLCENDNLIGVESIIFPCIEYNGDVIDPIENAKVDELGNLIITTTTGKYNAGYVIGEKGDQGEKGDLGKSAYQSAMEGGYTGTEDQFNHVLGMMDASTAQIGINKTNVEQLQNLFTEYNGLSFAYKNVIGNTIILEKEYCQYNIQISRNLTLNIDKSLLPLDKSIHFLAYFKIENFVSIQFADNVIFQDGKTMTDIGDYYYEFYYDEENTQWYAFLKYSSIRHINPNAKYLYVNGKNGNDAYDGLTWETAKQTIQDAIDTANEGDGIMIMGYDDGFEYLPTTERVSDDPKSKSFIMKNGVFLFGGCAGTEVTPGDIQMRTEILTLKLPSGASVHNIQVPVRETILSGDLNQENVFDHTIQDRCRYTSASMINNATRLIHSTVSFLTRISGVVFSHADASREYAGIVFDQNGLLQVTNSIVRDCIGISTNATHVPLNVILTNSIIEYLTFSTSVYGTTNDINYCLVRYSSNNILGRGKKASYCEFKGVNWIASETYSFIYNCYIHNSVFAYLYMRGGNSSITNSLIENCSYTANMFQTYTSSIVGNRIIIMNCNYASLFISRTELSNCLIANNKTINGIAYSTQNFTAVNCTIANNEGDSFAGIQGTNKILNNCTAWGNRVGTALSNISDEITCNYCAIENTDYLGVGNINISLNNQGDSNSPYFVNPSTTAGITSETTDYSIEAESVLIDKGNNSYLNGENQIFDVELGKRIVNDLVDLGAYEFQN